MRDLSEDSYRTTDHLSPSTFRYNSGMSGGEENAKRWRITIQEMLFAMTGIGLALTTVRFPTLWLLGLFAFGATVGSLLGRLHRGSVLFRDAYLGGLTMVGFYFLIAIALVTAMIIKSMLD